MSTKTGRRRKRKCMDVIKEKLAGLREDVAEDGVRWRKIIYHDAPERKGKEEDLVLHQCCCFFSPQTFKFSAMQHWVDQGAPPQKLNVGFAAYGRAFTLSSSSSCVGVSASGPSEEGCYTGQEGFWAYYEVLLSCVIWIYDYLSLVIWWSNPIQVLWHIFMYNVKFWLFCQICLYVRGVNAKAICEQKVPYAITENQWVGYDDKDSLELKVSTCFIMVKNYFTLCRSISIISSQLYISSLSDNDIAYLYNKNIYEKIIFFYFFF